ncbi:mitochondrial uncoupling protein 4 isoform X2 [Trachemys scripta elegans]|uniref:mitochondrial uncoupling protein 4 isoform X2 n=1 Tax=Trachemys scripta elegans TaxID=31138 RepID=UPI001556B706|nr:mitochondrial uncoupling protein 4 isoform X2 [Trachemys scripta elegans]
MLHAECYPQEERSLPFPERWPRTSKFALSACAAAVAELVTFPLDLTKTRLQIQGEAAVCRYGPAAGRAVPYRGMLRTAAGIIQEEGLLKLWQGATPAVYRHIVYSGVRMVTYEHIRDSVLGRAEDESFPLWRSVVGGMSAGAIGQFFASPTDLVKVQMQMEGKRRLEGKPLRFRGVHHAFVKILSEGGIRGLWAGWVPNVQRAALVNMGDICTYSSVKVSEAMLIYTNMFFLQIVFFIDSVCSGLVAAILGTPADVVKTRIMNQPRDKQGRGLLYKSSADCLIQAIQGEGFMSLYKGFLPTWMRMAPWSLVFWLTYEQIRRICGVSSF